MREHLDFHGHLDGYVITFRDKPITAPIATWTGVARTMTVATEALEAMARTVALEAA